MKKELTFRHRLICAIPYSLIYFLITYNCLKEYLDNCYKAEDSLFLICVLKKQLCSYQYFSAAFVWNNTPEGYDFWERRARWYRDYLQTNKL